jgi:LmbE family N-acetylglucosaminyl deacetylase
MLKLGIENQNGSTLKILCLGAHSDDIEIGCGGTMMRLIEEHEQLEIYWVVFSAREQRRREARASAQSILGKLKKKTIVTKNFRDGFFPFEGYAIKDEFEALKKKFSPDLILTHYRDDRHQDHRVVSDLTWNTFRDHLILEYEIPKYDGDIGNPNFYFELTRAQCERKRDLIMNHFVSQHKKHWFTENLLFSILRLRGMESGRSSEYAEAFYCRKGTV